MYIWLLSLSIFILGFICVVVYVTSSFLVIAESCDIV